MRQNAKGLLDQSFEWKSSGKHGWFHRSHEFHYQNCFPLLPPECQLGRYIETLNHGQSFEMLLFSLRSCHWRCTFRQNTNQLNWCLFHPVGAIPHPSHSAPSSLAHKMLHWVLIAVAKVEKLPLFRLLHSIPKHLPIVHLPFNRSQSLPFKINFYTNFVRHNQILPKKNKTEKAHRQKKSDSFCLNCIENSWAFAVNIQSSVKKTFRMARSSNSDCIQWLNNVISMLWMWVEWGATDLEAINDEEVIKIEQYPRSQFWTIRSLLTWYMTFAYRIGQIHITREREGDNKRKRDRERQSFPIRRKS